MIYRQATLQDATAIAQLHTRSWRQNYRGALSDEYLDQRAEAERLALWRERLESPIPERTTILVTEDKRLLGFICLELDADTQYGTLLDNLHVGDNQQGRGIGRELMRRGAAWAVERRPDSSIYLYVLAQNERAARFYERAGGTQRAELNLELAGHSVATLLIAWDDARALC